MEFSRSGGRRGVEPWETVIAPAVGCNDLFGPESLVGLLTL
jgi:hypothetical protein